MELKDFISQTLKEIFDGVIEVKKYCSNFGGNVAPKISASAKQDVTWEKDTGNFVQFVDFDVAVTASEGKGKKRGISVSFASLGLGAQGQSETTNTSYSRIKFKIPIVLPTTCKDEQEDTDQN